LADYHNELATRMQRGELFSAKNTMDDSVFQKPSKYHTANGRKVYSGGGIMPDVFVPADTMGNTELLYDLKSRELFMAYVIQKMQPLLLQYPTYNSFRNYQVNDTILSDFIVYATKTLKQLDSDEIRRSKSYIRLYIKAAAARFKWGDIAYYKTINQDDETLKAAIKCENE